MAMLVTPTANGDMWGRPMAPAEVAAATILLDVGIIYVVVGAGIEGAMNGGGMP
jgi:hypothetical protein